MSLFGNLSQNTGASAPTSGTSLFPSFNPNSTSDPLAKRKSIFEPSTSQAASQTTSQPSMFGTPAVAATNPARSLFGNLGASTNTTSTPAFSFGNKPAITISAPTASQASTTNPFAFPNQTSTESSNQQNTQQQQEGALKGQNRESAYFSSLLERQKKKARFSTPEQNGRLNQLPSVSLDLNDLARRAQELGARSGNASQSTTDGRAHYLLAGSGVSPGKAYRDFQSLESDGIERSSRSLLVDDRDAYLKGLQTKGREAMMKESMDRVYREVDAFIEQSLGIDFEEQKVRIMEHFGLVARDEKAGGDANGRSSFSRTKSIKKPDSTSRSVFGRSAVEKSMIGAAGSGSGFGTSSIFGKDATSSGPTSLIKNQTMRDLRDKERLFMERVQDMNMVRLQDKAFPVMQNFEQVERAAGGDSPKHLADAYAALAEITKETEANGQLRPRQYVSSYLDDTQNAAGSTKLKRQILEKSRTYLEKAFYRELESIIEKNPREAQLGGRPSVINKIRAYIRVRAARHDLAPDGSELQQIGDNGDYCWILIFYLLRSGYVKEAAEYVNNDAAFQSTDRRFVSYLTAYMNSPDKRLSRKLQEMIEGEYVQRAKVAPKGTVDPYRLACYKIIGRCDLSMRTLDAVGQGVEDWIWLQFSLAREVDRLEELSGEIFGLEQICETVTEIGERHFQKSQVEGNSQYGTYFLMQILAGLFEQAVDYLHTFNPVSAVHFAIALDYYGLLRVSDHAIAGTELLTFSTTQQPQINFVPLVAYYTAPFRTALPVAAVDYLSLICLNSDLTPAALGEAQTNACHECLRELCLETREFAALLGDIRSDGSRIPGAIEQRATLIKLETHEDFLKAVTSQAAAIADQRGQVADAVLLYHLCEDLDHVISVLIRTLADAVCVDLGESPMSLQPLKPRQEDDVSPANLNGAQSSLSLTQSTSSPIELANNMLSLYDSNAAYHGKIGSQNRETCKVLMKLLTIRAKLEDQAPKFMSALEQINSLGLLPLAARGNIPMIRQAAQLFSTLPQVLARCIGNVILWAVRAIGGERESLARQGAWDTGYGKDQDLVKSQLSDMARDLMVFAGLVKYKLPGRVYDLLTRAGGEVGGY